MAYLTVKDIEPDKLDITRSTYGGTSTYMYEESFTNERSFPHFVPVSRFARRLELADELTDPLYDFPKFRYLGKLCPVIDTEKLGAKRTKELGKFLPKHMELRTNALGETYITEKFDVVDRLFERYWEVMREDGFKQWAGHLATCGKDDHEWCYGNGGMWKDVPSMMTSGQYLRMLWDKADTGHSVGDERGHPLQGSDMGQNMRYLGAFIVTIWKQISATLRPSWQYDVFLDGDIPLGGYDHNGNVILNYRNHRLRNMLCVNLRLTAKTAASHGCNTLHDAYKAAVDQPMSSYRYGGEAHEEFTKTCRDNYSDAFINRLRPNGDGKHDKNRKRLIGVEDHNYARFDPMLPCRASGASGWMTFGLSLAREKPSLFTFADRDIANRPLQRALSYEKPEARLLVHHSNSIWRFVAVVPYWYYKNATRRYHMAMLIGLTLEDRECGVGITFPAMRGFDPETKLAIENSPFMSSAIQHALYKLSFMLKDWDREHHTRFDIGYGTYAQLMPLVDKPQRMASAKTYRSYRGEHQGVLGNMLHLVFTAFDQSDLWRSKEQEASLQRVARSVAVDAELQMAIDAKPEETRNRVLRLDA